MSHTLSEYLLILMVMLWPLSVPIFFSAEQSLFCYQIFMKYFIKYQYKIQRYSGIPSWDANWQT